MGKVDVKELQGKLEKVREFYGDAPKIALGSDGATMCQGAIDRGEEVVCRKSLSSRGVDFRPGDVYTQWKGNDRDITMARHGFFLPKSMYDEGKKKYDMKQFYDDEVRPLVDTLSRNDVELGKLRGALAAAEGTVSALRDQIGNIINHSEDLVLNIQDKVEGLDLT